MAKKKRPAAKKRPARVKVGKARVTILEVNDQVQLDALVARVEGFEERLRDVVLTIASITPVIAELRRFDQYIFDAVKRHEEQHHDAAPPTS